MDNRTRQENHAQPAEGEYVLSLGDLSRVIWRRFWIIVLVAVVLGGAAFGYSVSQVPVYESSLRMLVGQDSGISETPSDSLALQQLTETMSTAANSQLVAEDVVEREGLSEDAEYILSGLAVEPVPDTQFIELAYYDTDPERAVRIVEAFGEVFSEQISEVGSEAGGITARPWGQADVPESPVSPSPLRDAFLAAVLGGFLGLALVFLLEYLDDSWNSPEEAEEISGVPTFGVIPQFGASSGKPALASGGDRAPPLRSSAPRAYSRGAYSSSGAVEPYKAEYRDIAQDSRVLWPFGLALIDMDGKIEETNPALRQMLGYEEEELAGESFVSFATHPDDAALHEDTHKGLTEGESEQYQIEKRCIKKSGQVMWARLTVSLMRDPDGEARYSIGMVDDVTGRKQLEEELKLSKESQRSSEMRLKSIVEQSPVIVHTFTGEGFPLLANEAWRDFWGWGGGDGPNVFEDEGIRDSGLKPYIEESVKKGEAVRTPPLRRGSGENNGDEVWIRGSIHPVRAEGGQVLEAMLTVEDITEGQTSGQRLKRNESELSSLREAFEKSAAERDKSRKELEWSIAGRERAEEDLRQSVAKRERAEKSLKETQERFRSIIRFATDATNDDEGRGRG